MTQEVIPESRKKSYPDQCALLTMKNQQLGLVFEVPCLLDAAASIFMEYIRNGKVLYGNKPKTFTRCQEKTNTSGYNHVLGSYFEMGLTIVHFANKKADKAYGIASCWKLL